MVAKQGKTRRKKDPNAPKRGLSAFMFFGNDIRATIKKEQPDIEFLQIASEIGRRWQALSQEDRKQYDEMAAEDKKRYLEEKAEYVPDPSYQTTGRKKKDPNAPKRGLSAYLYYCNEHRQKCRDENPDKKITQIATVLAAQWKELSEHDRKKYVKLAEADKARYHEQMGAYNKAKEDVVEEEEEEEEEESD